MPSATIFVTRSGYFVAELYVASAPQSCPTTTAVASPRASSSNATSSAWSLVSNPRSLSVAGWYPRRYGATVRNPAPFSRARMLSQDVGRSGKPCRSSTSGPSPLSTYRKVCPPADASRHSIVTS